MARNALEPLHSAVREVTEAWQHAHDDVSKQGALATQADLNALQMEKEAESVLGETAAERVRVRQTRRRRIKRSLAGGIASV